VFFTLVISVVFFYFANEAVMQCLMLAFLGTCEHAFALPILWRSIGPFNRSRASCEQQSMVWNGGRETGLTDGCWHLNSVGECLIANS
jgi:hypothetical protein